MYESKPNITRDEYETAFVSIFLLLQWVTLAWTLYFHWILVNEAIRQLSTSKRPYLISRGFTKHAHCVRCVRFYTGVCLLTISLLIFPVFWLHILLKKIFRWYKTSSGNNPGRIYTQGWMTFIGSERIWLVDF